MTKISLDVATGEVAIDTAFDLEKWPEAPPAIDAYEYAVQQHIDDTANSKLFRDGVTLASYVASTNPQWAAEAQAFVAWRDQVWAHAYQELARVQAGEREQPSITEVRAELPNIAWP